MTTPASRIQCITPASKVSSTSHPKCVFFKILYLNLERKSQINCVLAWKKKVEVKWKSAPESGLQTGAGKRTKKTGNVRQHTVRCLSFPGFLRSVSGSFLRPPRGAQTGTVIRTQIWGHLTNSPPKKIDMQQIIESKEERCISFRFSICGIILLYA